MCKMSQVEWDCKILFGIIQSYWRVVIVAFPAQNARNASGGSLEISRQRSLNPSYRFSSSISSHPCIQVPFIERWQPGKP